MFIARSLGHEQGVSDALSLAHEVLRDVAGREAVIKVNFVSAHVGLSATPVEAVRAVLKFLEKHGAKSLIIVETPAGGTLHEAIINYGYYSLKEEFDVEFVDIDCEGYEYLDVWDSNLERRLRVGVSRLMLDSEYLVSVVRPKTHDTVVVTLSIKNVAVGAVAPPDRPRLHQGYKAINLSIAYIAAHMMPKLAVIDGYVGMEGDGPVRGTPKSLGLAIVGGDAVAVDSTTAFLMGFNPRDIGYLYYLREWGYGALAPEEVEVVGVSDWRRRVVEFRPHRTFLQQLAWRLTPEEYERAMRDVELPSS